jgi:hypothetical protein
VKVLSVLASVASVLAVLAAAQGEPEVVEESRGWTIRAVAWAGGHSDVLARLDESEAGR